MIFTSIKPKSCWKNSGVATTRGKSASTADEAEAIALELGDVNLAQDKSVRIADWWSSADPRWRARGRGPLKTIRGGVHVVKSPKEARELREMLGQNLVTHQTGRTAAL